MNEDDEIVGREETLLITSTTLSIDDAVPLVRDSGGFVFPSHIDRTSNGIIAILGDVPPEPNFTFVEFNDGENISEYFEKYPSLKEKKVLVNSDAHRITDINEAKNFLELDVFEGDEDAVRRAFFDYLLSAN